MVRRGNVKRLIFKEVGTPVTLVLRRIPRVIRSVIATPGGAPPRGSRAARGPAPLRREQAAEPMVEVPEPRELPSTSSVTDMVLEDLPLPTKKNAIAKHWRKVDMSKALEHEGSVLFEEKGKWTVMESCYVYPDPVEVPL